jgi:hypothetical protein
MLTPIEPRNWSAVHRVSPRKRQDTYLDSSDKGQVAHLFTISYMEQPIPQTEARNYNQSIAKRTLMLRFSAKAEHFDPYLIGHDVGLLI